MFESSPHWACAAALAPSSVHGRAVKTWFASDHPPVRLIIPQTCGNANYCLTEFCLQINCSLTGGRGETQMSLRFPAGTTRVVFRPLKSKRNHWPWKTTVSLRIMSRPMAWRSRSIRSSWTTFITRRSGIRRTQESGIRRNKGSRRRAAYGAFFPLPEWKNLGRRY